MDEKFDGGMNGIGNPADSLWEKYYGIRSDKDSYLIQDGCHNCSHAERDMDELRCIIRRRKFVSVCGTCFAWSKKTPEGE